MWNTPGIASHLYSGFGDPADDGARHQWLLGVDGSVRAVRSVDAATEGACHLTFYVSADLESVRMHVRWADNLWQSQKAYGRALVALARARIKDRLDPSVSPHEQGWLHAEELIALADYEDVGRLNVEVHRARADFARHTVPGADDIVQRRRGTGQLRLGLDRIEVVDGLVARARP